MTMKLLQFVNQAYVHKLNAQELGYRKNEPGKAGRYFYISKAYAGYFPPLSDTVLNDFVYLDIIPPHTNEVVLTKYVYHNSKHVDESIERGRDEYRLYLNSANDPGRDYYQPEDIILLVKLFNEENEIYKVVYVKKGTKDYELVSNLLVVVDPQRGTHGLIALKELTFLAALRRIDVGSKVIPQEIIKEALEEPVYHPPQTEAEEQDTTRVMRSRSFRDLVLFFYNYRCSITDKNVFIAYKDFNNLEAAHILARSSGGGSHPSNGLALERNLHWAFDKGFFTITKDYKVKVHENAMSVDYLKKQDGKELIVPEDSRTRPDLNSIEWHNKNVFGLFLKKDL